MNPNRGSAAVRIGIPVLCIAAVIFVAAIALRRRSGEEQGVAQNPGAPPKERTSRGVEVYSGMSGKPLKGAQASLRPATGAAVDLPESDDEGWIALEGKETGTLRVRAKGHVGQDRPLPLSAPVTRLYLTPTGSVELTFHSKDKRPISGVSVQLDRAKVRKGEFPQDPGLLTSEVEWKQVSDSKGAMSWTGLIPGTGYVWKVLSQHPVMDEGKPGEIDPFTPTPPQQGFQSGFFEVPAGSVVRLKARVGTLASVSGSVEGYVGLGPRPVVRLYHNTVLPPPPGVSRPMLEPALERVVEADAQGAFHLPAARPGKKTVQVNWRDGAKVLFAHVDFDLAPDEARNLGVLRAQPGNAVSGRVKLVGRENLPPEHRAADLQAIVNLMSIDHEGSAKIFAEKILVRVDEPFVVTGLYAGNFQASAAMYKVEKIPGVIWKESSAAEFVVPDVAKVELEVKAEAKIDARLTIVFPSAESTGLLKAMVFPALLPPPPEDPPDADPDKLPPLPEQPFGYEIPLPGPGSNGDKSRLTTTFPVTPGKYSIWVTSAPASRGRTQSTNFFGEVEARFGPDETNEVTVTLGPGAIIRGRTFNRNREPYATQLMVQADPFIDLRQPYLQTFTTDGSGVFVIQGLPPGRRIKFLDGIHVQTGAPGSETPADLIIRD